MDTIGAYEAKTKFSALLERVEKGETITITKHGRPVAQLVPAVAKRDPAKIAAAIADIKRLREGVILGPDLTIRQLREEGRR